MRVPPVLNERMGLLTGYERTLLALVPAIEMTADREDAPVEELAQDWERERNALERLAQEPGVVHDQHRG